MDTATLHGSGRIARSDHPPGCLAGSVRSNLCASETTYGRREVNPVKGSRVDMTYTHEPWSCRFLTEMSSNAYEVS